MFLLNIYIKWRVHKWSNSEQALETDFEAKNGGFVGAATSKAQLAPHNEEANRFAPQDL